MSERPDTGTEDTVERQALHASERRTGKRKKVHSLIDKVFSRKNFELAWEKVKKNRGSAGIDDVTIGQFEEHKDFYLDLLHRKLREGTYQPKPVKRVEIPKSGGGQRKLGVPAVIDRVCQQALVQRMGPIFEPGFSGCSFGYRKGRSPHDAMRKVWQELTAGNEWIVDADLREFLDSIDQERLIDLVAEEISDGRVLRLVRDMLRAGVVKRGKGFRPISGRGGPMLITLSIRRSPALSIDGCPLQVHVRARPIRFRWSACRKGNPRSHER